MIQSTYNEQIHNTELQFLKQLTYQPLETGFLRSARLNNYSTLSQLLKVKNQKYGFSQTVKQQGQSWIRKKGADINKKAVDLNTFVDRVKNEKQLIIQKKQQKKCQSQCQFYIPHLSYDNQNQYIAKNFQFGVVNTIQSIYNIDKNKGNLAKRILNKRTINRINHVQTYLQRLPIINMQVRNSIKKLQYLEATKVVLSIGKIIKGSKWAEYYKNSTKQSFWEILTTQVSFLQTYKGELPFQNIAIISLKMVEKEYDRTLPHTPDSITNYLTNNYLGKMRNAFDVDGSKGPNWGTSFVLYRAGRLQQFYFVIDDPQLKSYFQKSQASIREGNPQKISQKQEQDDLFYNQLIYALRGQAKCSSKALSQPDSLDVVWVFLRNMAIYKSNYPTFMTLRNDLYESYRGPYINQLQIKNLFYLLAYGQIAQIGTNDIMDHDDYLHYLIAIYHSPVFELIQSDKKQLIERKLTQNLVQYIQQLLCQHKDDYIRYMVLIPPSKIVEQISSIITSSHLIETLDWKYLAKMLNPDIYEKLTYLSLQKYAVFHQQYVHVAKKSCQLLGTNKMALELILEMLIKSLLSNISVSALQIQKGQQLAKDLLRRDENLFKKYGPVFRFFDQFIKLIVLVTQRSQSKIYEFLRQSKFILIAETVRAEIKEAIDMLVQFKGFQCFILYLKYMVKAYGIGLKRLNQINDLRQLHYLTFVALSNLMKSQSYSQFYNLESVKELFRTIEQNIKQFQ